jgi:hypothetical protein
MSAADKITDSTHPCQITPAELEYLSAVEGTLGEWVGATDEETYRDL